MKRKNGKWKRMLLLLIGVLFLLGTNASAASTAQKKASLKAYKSFLARKSTYARLTTRWGNSLTKINMNKFTLIDLDGNGIKELIVNDGKWDEIHVFTYKNKKVTYVGSDYHSYFPVRYNKKYKGIAVYHTGAGGGGMGILSLRKGKLAERESITYASSVKNGKLKMSYRHNGKKISEKTYNSYVKKYESKNIKKYTMRTNTAKNRTKYVK